MINNPSNLATQMPIGGGDLSALRQSARQNTPEAIKATAQQFEALFMNMVMKSMREATPQGGLFDNPQSKMYTSLLDDQLSQNFAKRGIGLADALIRQLTANSGPQPLADMPAPATSSDNLKLGLSNAIKQQQASLAVSMGSDKLEGISYSDNLTQFLASTTGKPTLALADNVSSSIRNQQALLSAARGRELSNYSSIQRSTRPAHVVAFQDKLGAHAEKASRETGIPAKFMLGQAALESGWGKRVMAAADGSSSHNLFGIKASKGWTGKVVETNTTEYVNGVAYKKKEKFRAYDSYADSFRDYAKLLQTNPRYKNVLANAQDASSFAQGLQRAGYATDPQYAAKLTRIIQQSFSA